MPASPPTTPAKGERDVPSLSRIAEERFYGVSPSHPSSSSSSSSSSFQINDLIGVDEAGRGPLAGPVVVCACSIRKGVNLPGIIDSKATKEKDREKAFDLLTTHPDVRWSVEIIDEKTIDKINILQASLLGMRNATAKLLTKYKQHLKPSTSLALVDGNKIPTEMPTNATVCVVKGDSTIFSIAAASIIAKVTRDRLMLELDKKFPQYEFAKHKGYPTLTHRTLLMQYGPSDVHRISYSPVKEAYEKFAREEEVKKRKGGSSKESVKRSKTHL